MTASGVFTPVSGVVQVAPAGGARTRSRLVDAAFELFGDRGYDATTVEAIAERAGIARRTFFRYFRSKDDVIFPDHDTQLAVIAQFLAAAAPPPVAAVCSAVRLVFRSYLADPEVSVERYRVARRVDALRQREIASVWRYERLFAGYLRSRLAGRGPTGEATPGGASSTLSADIVAAAVVAAHNSVLREWLRDGGAAAPEVALHDLDRALDFVVRTYEPPGAEVPDTADATVVAVFRAPGDVDDVVHRLRAHLGDGETST
jgi:AcrR family transcriptional regulator